MKGFSLIEILFSLSFLAVILHITQTIFFQTNKYNQSTATLNNLSEISYEVNLANNKQNTESPFASDCQEINKNSLNTYSLFSCKIGNKDLLLWKKKY